jgi:uncharacterized protein (DUF1015 family)
MARVRPFAAWRYRSTSPDITPLVAPPYDVISAEQRAALIEQDRHNVVALELPQGPEDTAEPGNRYEVARATWDEWREAGVVAQDESPSVYVIEQRYTVGDRPVRRRAFIAAVGLEPFDAGVILPHERTLPKALGDRLNLTVATAANLSQVFGLFEDADGETDSLFDSVCTTTPIASATDADGVVSTLWASADAELTRRLSELMESRQIYIADGHHRYTTALAYRDARKEADRAAGHTPADPAYDYVLMALVNMDDPDLTVLATHRVADAAGEFDASAFVRGLTEHFEVAPLSEGGHPSDLLDAAGPPRFLVKLGGEPRPFVATLRDGVDLETVIRGGCSPAWKSLDVAVLQELVLTPLLGIDPDLPETLERLLFVKDAHAALTATAEHDVAFLMRPTRMDQLRAVARAGEIMPQKSTYFYPKLLSGMLFRSAE